MSTLLARLTAVPLPVRLLCALGLLVLLLLSLADRSPVGVPIPPALPMLGSWAPPHLAWHLREFTSAVLALSTRLAGRCWSAWKVALA